MSTSSVWLFSLETAQLIKIRQLIVGIRMYARDHILSLYLL